MKYLTKTMSFRSSLLMRLRHALKIIFTILKSRSLDQDDAGFVKKLNSICAKVLLEARRDSQKCTITFSLLSRSWSDVVL